MGRHLAVLLVVSLATAIVSAQTGSSESTTIVLRPARVFDGQAMHEGWAVRVVGDRIDAAGPAGNITTANARVVDLAGLTLTPGLVEGHSHVLLHPYNEAPWEFQVAHEPLALRTARAVNALRATLMAGFTTIRDLGTEGAGYADVGLRDAVAEGIVPGPRMWVSTKAIVVTGQYAPKGFATEYMNNIPQGAEEANGVEGFIRVVRDEIKHGADWIKIYADYRWGPNGEAMPGPTLEEFTAAVSAAKSSGRNVAAHATTAEGMRRAILAGVATIEHGDNGTPEVFKLMAEKGVCYVPTVSVGGRNKKAVLQMAMDAGVMICNGSDSGPVPHGENARELDGLVANGLT